MAHPLAEDDRFNRNSQEALSSTLTCPMLIGRAREVQQLDQALPAARAGLGHGVLIAGEAGVGKSRLLAGFEQFVMEMSEWASNLAGPPTAPPDVAKLGAIGAKYGIDILGPLPRSESVS